jgi:hypothetical protein
MSGAWLGRVALYSARGLVFSGPNVMKPTLATANKPTKFKILSRRAARLSRGRSAKLLQGAAGW